MGYCLITGGGTDGRYDIELDFGKAQKDAILAALTSAINKNDLDILQTENEIAEAQAQEQALGLVLLQLQDTIATGTAAEKAQATIEYPKRVAQLARLKVQNEPLRYKLRQLKFVRASLRKQAQQFNLFQPIQRKQAWCADLTEDRAAGSYVGTIEVKGEPDLVLIQPGARAWIPTDGRVTGREVMSPWQAYWNAAVFPGWQKWKPTYRWGTLTAINRGANTGTVDLATATSSAQRLGINQESTLENVPFSYMTCNASAFDVDDRVIVRFTGQDWAEPMVIGFLDNPKSCGVICIGLEIGGYVLFRHSSQPIRKLLYDNRLTLTVEAKANGGSFNAMPYVSHGENAVTYWRVSSNPQDIIVTLYSLGQEVTYIGCAVTPPLPFVLTDPDRNSNRNVVEIKLVIAGEIVVNFANTDGGWSGTAQYHYALVRCRGGAVYAPVPPFGTYNEVGQLNYTLVTD